MLSQPSDDALCYYSKSRDAAPGKGVNEHIQDAHKYVELSRIRDWRKILSNFYVAPFIYQGKTYNTVEHAIHATKFKLANPVKADWFTVDSGHEIGQGGGLDARKKRKLVALDVNELERWNRVKDQVMHEIMLAKFTQNDASRNALMHTRDTQLWHVVVRKGIIRVFELEAVRSELQTGIIALQ